MYYVYVLKSINDSRLYFGYTDDLKRRFREHNEGKSPYTKKFKPWKLVYYEAYLSQIDARKREQVLKRQRNVKSFLKKRIEQSLHED